MLQYITPYGIQEKQSSPRHAQGFRALFCSVLVLVSAVNKDCAAQTATVSVVPDADSFIRALAPASNYGAAGALSVSGSAAVNGSGDSQGLADTLMRFPMSNVVAMLDSALGGHDWVVTEVRLVLSELASPDNAIFNRGVGSFEVRWIATDAWTEGTGKPLAPTTDGVAWQDLSLILNSNLDLSLGVFTNSGTDAQVSFSLALATRLLEDVRLGGEVGLYLTAQSPGIGFTFNSRSFGNTNAQPNLMVTAAANPRPRIDSIGLVGTNVVVGFRTVSNWTYRVQSKDIAEDVGVGWSNLATVPAQGTNGSAVIMDGITSRQRLYRLSVSP